MTCFLPDTVEVVNMGIRVKKAIIPVAGLGTRFLPITKSVPKEMLPVLDRPVIHLIVEEAVRSGIEQIIFVNGRHKSSIEDYFDIHYEMADILKRRGHNDELHQLDDPVFSSTICSVRQQEAKGLGHAVLCARPFVGNEPFAVLLGDDVIHTRPEQTPGLQQLLMAYTNTNASQIGLMRVPHSEIHRYGAAEVAPLESGGQKNWWRVIGLVEKPKTKIARSDCAVAGRYVLTPSIWNYLADQTPDATGEIQLTDALSRLLAHEPLMGVMLEGDRVDVGDRIGFLKMNIIEALSRDELHHGVANMLREMVTQIKT